MQLEAFKVSEVKIRKMSTEKKNLPIDLLFFFQEFRTNEPRHEKTNILVSDLVGHKPGCTAREDG